VRDISMKILLSREKSSMVSTWTEMIGFFQEKSGDWILGNCGYEILGSIHDLLTEKQIYSDEGFQVPDEVNGVKIHGISDGEYLESEEIIFSNETVIFNKANFQKAVDYFEMYDWNTHSEYEIALKKIRSEVFS
jgi:hypothetical protein